MEKKKCSRKLATFFVCGLTAIAFGSTSAIHAQTRWSVDLEGGLAHSTLTEPDEAGALQLSPRNSVSAAGSVAYRVSSRWSLATKLQYAARGARWTGSDGELQGARLILHTPSLNLSLLANLGVFENRMVRVEATAGVQAGRTPTGDVHEQSTDAVVGRVPVKHFSEGAVFGGRAMSRNHHPIFFALVYVFGLTDATESGGSRMRSLEPSVGVRVLNW